MRTRALFSFLGAAAAALLGGCRTPTQITLEIETDIDCSRLLETSISTGNLSELPTKPPTSTTTRCQRGRIGSLVLVPSGSNSEEVALQVVTGVGTSAAECAETGFSGDCIVARRALRFVPHTRLRLPVSMSEACLGVPCDQDSTCVDGVCVSATIENVDECATSRGCAPKAPDAGADGGIDATADAMPDQATMTDAGADASIDAPVDATSDAPADAASDAPVDVVVDAPMDASTDAADSGGVAGPLNPTLAFALSADPTSGSDIGWDVSVDALGNTYAVGEFTGQHDFGSGTPLDSSTGPAFVASYTQQGQYRWAKNFSVLVTQEAAATPGGDVYLGGWFNQPVSFGGSTLVPTGTDVFIVKLDTNGNHVWSKGFGGAGLELLRGLATDDSGNVYACGVYSAPFDFGDGPLTAGGKIYAVSLDPAGTTRWSDGYVATGPLDNCYDVAVDSAGNSFLVGQFSSLLDFGTEQLNATSQDGFLASLDANGQYRWSVKTGGSGMEQTRGVGADRSGNVTVSGSYSAALDLGDGVLPFSGANDIFLAVYDSLGQLQWSRGFGGPNGDQPFGLAVDYEGNSYFAGIVGSVVDFGTNPVSSFGSSDVFIASASPGGIMRWARVYGDTGLDQAQSVAVGRNGAVAITGQYEGTPDFGAGPLPNGAYGFFLTVLE